MKKVVLAFVAIVFLSLSCSKTEKAPEIMTFTVNGISKDFSKNVTVVEYTDEVLISGKTANAEYIMLTLPKSGIGTYSDTTYNSMGSGVVRPNIFYMDANGNSWKYYGSYYYSYTTFRIAVKKYNSTGEVSGTFKGTLEYSYGNGASMPDSVVITNGVFSHQMTSVTE